MNIPDRCKLPLAFDPKQLANDLKALQETQWIEHFVRQNYEGNWDVIPLRGKAGATHPVMMIYSDPGCVDFQNTPFLEKTPYIQSVLSTFECSLHAVRLMRLAVNSKIKEHRDYDLDVESGVMRLHIPIVTNDAVDFQLNQSRVVMAPGECWYLRLSDPHSVVNNGESDRVHLVIDVEVNDWLKQQLTGA